MSTIEYTPTMPTDARKMRERRAALKAQGYASVQVYLSRDHIEYIDNQPGYSRAERIESLIRSHQRQGGDIDVEAELARIQAMLGKFNDTHSTPDSYQDLTAIREAVIVLRSRLQIKREGNS